jgi:hypothetical protein
VNILVAFIACHQGVFAIQRERGFGVVEMRHLVAAIVAGLASLSELARVQLDERSVLLAVTIPATGGGEGKLSLEGVAGRASHGRRIEIHLV